MGAEGISDKELEDLGIEITEDDSSGARMLKIPKESVFGYVELIKAKLDKGFWNEVVGPRGIVFVFKFMDGRAEEYVLSEANERKIDRLCAEFNNEPVGNTANVYKYIAGNEFYRDFMLEHYEDMINR